MNITLNLYLALLLEKYSHVAQTFSSDTKAMGRFVDVVGCDLSVTLRTVQAHRYEKDF